MLRHSDIICGALGRRFCRAAYDDVLRAAKLEPDRVKNDMLYEDGGELTLLPTE